MTRLPRPLHAVPADLRGLVVGALMLAVLCVVIAAALVATALEDDPQPLVDEWLLNVDSPIPVELGNPVDLTGVFVCNPAAIEANPLVEFRSSFADGTPVGGWEIARPVNPPRELAPLCNPGSDPVPFTYAFGMSELEQLEQLAAEGRLDLGDRFTVRLSVAAIDTDRWIPAEAVTVPVEVILAPGLLEP